MLATDLRVHVEHGAARRRHRICIVDMSYTKHFVWNALPEELAAGCCQSVGVAWTLEQLLIEGPCQFRTFCARIELGS